MTETQCKICSKEILWVNSLMPPTFPIKTELTIDENPIACTDCKIEIDEEYQTSSALHPHPNDEGEKIKEEIVKDEYLEESALTNRLSNYSANDKSENVYKHLFKCKNLLQCYDCGYQTESKTNLEFHMLTHKRLFQYCDRSRRKKTTHVHKKTFSCKSCDYCCTQRGNLNEHTFKHLGAWPYACNECDYKCGYKSRLTRHMTIHAKEKPFKCKLCDYSCVRSSQFNNHTYKHTGEWPFRCNECDYKCVDARNLARHTRTHSIEKPFKCELCDYSCEGEKQLKNHRYKHFGD
ncbi:hypothetical protein FQR65_LT14004 [Abscondita terminalis]|nr:hypothetical protein FQR65_LT14004 [Abscondita terminalis]